MKKDPPKNSFFDVLIVGGGLAGLCSAIDLSSNGLSVAVIEKNGYPKHKVCGEYVSNETLPYLNELGIDPFELGAVRIEELDFSGPDGNSFQIDLPLGGFGISRYTLDHALMNKALDSGVEVIQDRVHSIDFQTGDFQVKTKRGHSFLATFVIGAYGKRSQLDKKLSRSFIGKRSEYVALKAHYKGDFPENRVGLYNFNGGYCGVSNVENRRINVCYIVDYEQFQKFENPSLFEENVLKNNDKLKRVLEESELLFDKPLSISQISFERKELIVDHVLMCGDSASLIHPLCGNGMGMAIGAARLVSQAILSYFNKKLETREEVERQYSQLWKENYESRLRTGHALSALLRNYKVTSIFMPVLKSFPSLLRKMIKATHGKAELAT